jgi:hypothetical protein
MNQFSTISAIAINRETSWNKKHFLTLDIDWANDIVLNDTIDLVESFDVAATWFVTHQTPVLERLRKNSKFEIGIHPNFNFLLDGMYNAGQSAIEVVQRLMVIVPQAKTVRSHSMTQSTGLLNVFKDVGLTHDANHFVPHHSSITLKPWSLWNGLCRVPYSWEDDVHIIYEAGGTEQQNPRDIALSESVGLKVFDFHPIHVFLNTESLDRYERTRPLHQNPNELIKHRYDGYGTRSRLIELLELTTKLL